MMLIYYIANFYKQYFKISFEGKMGCFDASFFIIRSKAVHLCSVKKLTYFHEIHGMMESSKNIYIYIYIYTM